MAPNGASTVNSELAEYSFIHSVTFISMLSYNTIMHAYVEITKAI